LTATLYLDFGDRFAGGTLTDTQGNLRAATVNGPRLEDASNLGFVLPDATNLTFTTFDAEVANAALDYNGSGGAGDAADAAALRAAIVSLVQRYYEPFDITVVALTSTFQSVNGHMVRAAQTLADVTATLGANNGDAEHWDAYAFVTGLTAAAPRGIPGGLNGQAGGGNFDGTNTTDDTVVNIVNHAFTNLLGTAGLTAADADTALAHLIAHEAGHSFGLEHTVNSTAAPNDTERISISDVMAQFYNSAGLTFGVGADQRANYVMFSRFPVNTVDGTPATQNSGQDLLNDTEIGAAPGARAYITGTGAFDRISVNRVDATNATVTVNAYRESSYTNLIGTFTYQVAYTSGLLIDMGFGDDEVTIDGRLDAGMTLDIVVRGMAGSDQVIVDGHGAATGSYRPAGATVSSLDGSTSVEGRIEIGSTTIDFREFEVTSLVTIQNLVALTLFSPAGADAFFVTNSTTAGRGRIRGTVNDGVDFVPLEFSGIQSVTIDAGNNDNGGASPNDAVFLFDTLAANGLQNFVVDTGAGDDTFLTFAPSLNLPVSGGSIRFLGGSGTDGLKDFSGVNRRWTVTGTGAGTLESAQFTGVENLTGGTQADTFVFLSGGSILGSVDGDAGSDTVDLSDLPSRALALTAQGFVDGYDGSSFGVGAGFQNINAIRGSTLGQTDRLTGLNENSTWLFGPGSHTYQSDLSLEALSLVNFESFTGGSANDLFQFQAGGAISGGVNGAAGADVLDLSDRNASTISLTALGNVDGYNGGAFGAGAGSQFSNINEIRGSAAGTPDVIVGLDADSTWTIATGAEAYRVNASAESLALANFETFRGGSLIDTFNVNRVDAARTLEGQGGNDFFDIGNGDLANIQAALTVLSGAGNNDRIRIDDDGNAASVDYNVTPTMVTSSPRGNAANRGFAGITYDGSTESLELFGTNSANTFDVTPSLTTAFIIDGSDPATGTVPPRSGDYLRINFTNVQGQSLELDPNVPGAGIWQFTSGHQAVAFRDIERFNGIETDVVYSNQGGFATAEVRVFDAVTGRLRLTIPASRLYGPSYVGGVRAVTGDLNGDGIPDVLIAPLSGTNPTIYAFDGVTGRQLFKFNPYAGIAHYYGAEVAIGDVNGDGWNDIVVSPGKMQSAPIRVFNGNPNARALNAPPPQIGADLYPFGRGVLTGEMSIAVADQNVNGDANRGRIVVGTSFRNAATIRSFELNGGVFTQVPGSEFKPLSPAAKNAPRVTTGDVNGDGVDDIVLTAGIEQSSVLAAYSATGQMLMTPVTVSNDPFSSVWNPLFIDAHDNDGDGRVETVSSFRSVNGIVGTVTKLGLPSGGVAGTYTANLGKLLDLSGIWVSNGTLMTYRQDGTQIQVSDSNGRFLRALSLSGTKLTLTTSVIALGTVDHNVIRFTDGTVAERLDLTGYYIHNGNLARIEQQGAELKIFDGTGKLSGGQILSPTTLSATNFGLTATIRFDGLSWSDNSTWTRIDLGEQFKVGTKTASLTQYGNRLVMVNALGQTSAVIFKDATTLRALDFGLDVFVLRGGLQIGVNGEKWFKAETLLGKASNRDVKITVQGGNIAFTDALGRKLAATVTGPNRLNVQTLGGATIERGRIVFDSGLIWYGFDSKLLNSLVYDRNLALLV
jgi:hypothetical protein